MIPIAAGEGGYPLIVLVTNLAGDGTNTGALAEFPDATAKKTQLLR